LCGLLSNAAEEVDDGFAKSFVNGMSLMFAAITVLCLCSLPAFGLMLFLVEGS
jgi:hypothetical protein